MRHALQDMALGDGMAKPIHRKKHIQICWKELRDYTKVEIGMANVNRITKVSDGETQMPLCKM